MLNAVTPVVTISFLLQAQVVTVCLSPTEGDNCLLPKQKEERIIIILMRVTGLIFWFFFFLAMKEGVHSIYLTSCQKISRYSVFFLLPSHCTSSTEFSNLPGAGADAAAAQGSLLPSVTSAQI